MISGEAFKAFFKRVQTIPFAPTAENIESWTLTLEDFVSTDEQLAWLAERLVKLYKKFPPPLEIRACFCGKFKPKDGINAFSETYPDGIPSEREDRNRAITGPELKALPSGHVASADPSLDAAIKLAAGVQEVKDLPLRGPATAAEIAAAPDWLRSWEDYPALPEQPPPVATPKPELTPRHRAPKREGSSDAFGADPQVREKMAELKNASDLPTRKRLAAELDLLLLRRAQGA